MYPQRIESRDSNRLYHNSAIHSPQRWRLAKCSWVDEQVNTKGDIYASGLKKEENSDANNNKDGH